MSLRRTRRIMRRMRGLLTWGLRKMDVGERMLKMIKTELRIEDMEKVRIKTQ